MEAARRLYTAIPGSRYVVVPGAEHFAQDDDPDTVSPAIREFLESL